MKVFTVVGARPQFIKAAPVSRALRQSHQEYLVHTGQHYDENMSQLFFDELDIPVPDMNLDIGSGLHAEQTGKMMIKLEMLMQATAPDCVMVYGDTNSTIAGSLTASKLNIPVVHVEAGLRSYNRRMPEEINRVLTDKISNLLLCPTQTAVDQLDQEGITNGVYLTGDVMFDAALYYAEKAKNYPSILDTLGIAKGEYLLATCHRPQNTDDPEILDGIIDALIQSKETIIFPAHPRTKSMLEKFGLVHRINSCDQIKVIEPVGYLQMIQLEKNAKKIVTDSGGVQKEAYFYKVPCITLRPETEWIETVQDGWNVLVGCDVSAILDAVRHFNPDNEQNNHYGDGKAGEKIVSILEEQFA